MSQRRVFALFAWCCAIANADRDAHKSSVKMGLTRDGHFHLGVEEEKPAPKPVVSSEGKVNSSEPRRVKALLPVELHAPPLLPVERKPEQTTRPSGSSFVNRTDDWMTLSQLAAGSLASTKQSALQMNTPAPTVPPERYKKKPGSWPSTAWNSYKRAYEKLAPLRGGVGNAVATAAAMFLGPDSCILKILYVFFSMEGEDDYPYIPRGCGDMFDFALNANSIPVPWMLIVGALATVITNSLH